MKNIHCNGCTYLASEIRKDISKDLKKSLLWCCAKGQLAEKAIAWCKTHSKKTLKTNK